MSGLKNSLADEAFSAQGEGRTIIVRMQSLTRESLIVLRLLLGEKKHSMMKIMMEEMITWKKIIKKVTGGGRYIH